MRRSLKWILPCAILLIVLIAAAVFLLFPSLRIRTRTGSYYTPAEISVLEEIFGVSLSGDQTVVECRLTFGITPQAVLWADLNGSENNLSFSSEVSYVRRAQPETAYTPGGEAVHGGICYERSDPENAGEKVILYSDSRGRKYLYCTVPELTKEQTQHLEEILKQDRPGNSQ